MSDREPILTPCPGQTKSVIDLTLVPTNLKPLSSWITLIDCMGSNHSSIIINIGIPSIFHQFFSYKYNLNKVHRNSFIDSLLIIHKEDKVSLLSDSSKILNIYYYKFV